MIYAQGMFQLNTDGQNYAYYPIPPVTIFIGDYISYSGNNYYFALKDNAVYLLGVIENASNCYYGLCSVHSSLPFIYTCYGVSSFDTSSYNVYFRINYNSSYGLGKLKEGWYINYMGCVYDYQGNIVE